MSGAAGITPNAYRSLDRSFCPWKAQREAERSAISNAGATYTTSSGTSGSALYEWLTGAGALSSAGPAVTERTAMAIGAVYACVGLISGAIANLPLKTYRRNGDSRESYTSDLWWLLNEQPTPSMSAAVMWEYLTWSLLLHGDAFAKIERASRLSPTISGFSPRHPLNVSVARNGDRLVYLAKTSTPERSRRLTRMTCCTFLGSGLTGFAGFLRCAIRQNRRWEYRWLQTITLHGFFQQGAAGLRCHRTRQDGSGAAKVVP